ncbi:MAG TPA: hypothetical protein VM242_08220 [Acidimicrobiales bacterium]|nr:hypothetical protein [Acidimicrobiales bacterium]
MPVLLDTAEVGAQDGDQITERLEGCRASATVYPVTGPFVCPDSAYTTGNLGSGWNELDLVPHRLTLQRSANSSTPSYEINIVADAIEGGTPGYDFISVPVINTALSHTSCAVSSSGLQTKTPGVGGTDTSIYRTLTVSHDPGTTCVLDYYQRLALGSSKYAGSSLHANVSNKDFTLGGVGARDVSIPVREIQPQRLDKTMTATQGSSHVWNVTKSAQPANLHFADTCSSATGSRTQQVQITIRWEKLAPTPSGQVTIVTSISATNPAHRPLVVSVTDVIRSGTTVLDTKIFDPVTLAPNAVTPIGTHTLVIDASQAVNLNDIATGTYTDPVPGHPAISLTTTATATATVQSTGTSENATAVISDTESITGAGLDFAVTGVSGASGSFTGYTAGTFTTGPVVWTSEPQSGNGSVTFTKTVRVDQPRITSGTLSDTASLLGADGFATSAGPLNVAITSSAVTTLTINKTIPNILQGAETVTFVIDVYDADRTTVLRTVSFTFTAGQTNKSTSVSLPPGTYDVVEQTTPGWSPQPAADNVNLNLPTCANAVTFNNQFGPASARVVKVTNPVGNQAGWVMCLLGPGTPVAPGECRTTDAGGNATFLTPLEEGNYSVTETPRTGFDQTGAVGCSFTVNYPADSGRVFTCTFTNTQRATVTVVKTTSGQVPPPGAFTFDIRTGASTTSLGTILDSDTNDAAGVVDFDGANPLQPGTYQVCETGMLPGWESTLSGMAGAFVPGSDLPDPDNSVVCVPFTLAPGENRTFTVNNTPPPGGDARTIGFWRNWSSCTGGNQDDVLDETLAEAGGILIGDLLVDTCAEGVSILSKSTLTGKKMASDAAYGLAAQLLAARLNVVADAGTCAAAITAMNQGQALLDSINFTGTGDYLGPKVKGSTLTLRNQALAYADTLDRYNNNTLCP